MNKDREQLISFGFGLAILIPYFVMLNGLETKVGFLRFALGLVLLLVVIAKFERIKVLYFLMVLALYWRIWGNVQHQGIGVLPTMFLVLALGLLVISCIKIERLEPFFKAWMKAAHFIGMVITGVLLGALFYLVFAPAGLILRIFRKDLLDQRIEPEKTTYWQKRKAQPFDPKSYQQQF